MTAIPFPVDLYEIQQSASSSTHLSNIERDTMDDGTPHLRLLNKAGHYQTWPIHFAPMDVTKAKALINYIRANGTQEFLITYMDTVWSGYIWSDAKSNKVNNQWYITVDFYGKDAT